MKQLFPLLAGALLLAACGNGGHEHQERTDGFSEAAKTPEDSLYKAIMEGHDSGMGKMGKLKGYQQQAIAAMDSISKLPDSPAKKQMLQTYSDLKSDLAMAEQSMNSWMNEFNPDSATDNKELRIKYLTGEKSKVDQVKESIRTSLQRADSIFRK